MVKKLRVPIPDDVAAEILFLSDRTCCVCNDRGKQVQIHHIDERPENNDINNLSVLCFDCHNLTQIKGGFGRKFGAKQIIKYRNEWIDRVKARKDKADEIASIQTVTGSKETMIETEIFDDDLLDYKIYNDPNLLKEYLDKILSIHWAQLTIAQIKWDTGITTVVNQGNYDLIDFYEEVLIELSTFYPKGHFKNQNPKKYFSEIISSKFLWHRLVLEPQGIGTGGTIVSTMTGGNVMFDVKRMVVDMVNSLILPYEIKEHIDIQKWKEEWLNENHNR